MKSLNIEVPARDLANSNARHRLQNVMRRWLPLARATLDMAVAQLPAAALLSDERAERLLCPVATKFDSLPVETQKLKDGV